MILMNPVIAKMCKSATDEAQQRKVIELFYTEMSHRVEDAITQQKHMLLWGEPGSCKSSVVQQVLKQHPGVHVHKNKTTPLEFYVLLWENRKPGNVLVLDDCDSWFTDQTCHSTLMSAVDTNAESTVHWNDNSTRLRELGIEPCFKFEGTVIIITNKPMVERSSSTKKEDMKINQILGGRMNPFCANLPDNDWNMLAIKMTHQAGGIQCFAEANSPAQEQQEIIDFIEENKDDTKRLSFRTIAQVLKTKRARGADWKFSAQFDLMS